MVIWRMLSVCHNPCAAHALAAATQGCVSWGCHSGRIDAFERVCLQLVLERLCLHMKHKLHMTCDQGGCSRCVWLVCTLIPFVPHMKHKLHMTRDQVGLPMACVWWCHCFMRLLFACCNPYGAQAAAATSHDCLSWGYSKQMALCAVGASEVWT
jgi:hypothetical protein